MHISALLLTLAASASLSSACTFGFRTARNYNTADKSGAFTCEIMAWESNDASQRSDRADEADKISCSGECKTLKFKGAEWEFCHEGIGNNIDLKGKATVQRKGGGTKVNIFPDGEDHHDLDQTPFSSMDLHSYWRHNIGC